MILWQELRDQVGNTVSSGLDLTGEILRTGVPLARSALAQAPTIINTTRQVSTVKTSKSEEYFSIIYGIYLFNAPLLPGPGHAQLRPEPRPRDGDCGGRHQGRLGRLPRGEVSSDWWTRGHVTAILTPDWSQRRPRAGEPGLQAGRQHHQGRQRHGASYRGRHPGGHQELHYH